MKTINNRFWVVAGISASLFLVAVITRISASTISLEESECAQCVVAMSSEGNELSNPDSQVSIAAPSQPRSFWSSLFDTSDFPKRWNCGHWSEPHGWLHIVSDLAIWGAYLAIPIILIFFIRRRPDMPFPGVFWLFGAFIVACGLTHLLEALMFWWPAYRTMGLVKLATAIVSWLTVVALIPVIPKALSMRTPEALQHEIDERQRAERHFRNLLESAPDAMVIVDEAGLVTQVNVQLERLFEFDRKELIGQSVQMLVPARFHESHLGHMQAYTDDPHPRGMGAGQELLGTKKTGEEFPVEISLSPIDMDEGVLIAAAVRDASNRKLVEQQLKRSATDARHQADKANKYADQLNQQRSAALNMMEDAQEARLLAERALADLSVAQEEIDKKNRDLETLLYVTSHDLREPLRAIGNFSKMVRDRYSESIDEKGQDLLFRVVRGAERMDNLIEDVLTLSRAQRMDEEFGNIEGKAIIDEALLSLQLRVHETNADIQISDDIPTFYVSKRWAIQGVFNLIANALKFAKPDESPQITIEGYTCNGPHGPEVGLIVHDRGPGVPPEHADRIFRLFQRAVGREVEGTGAGLALVRQIAERHGGRAWVEPRDGGGSSFYITFAVPVAKEPTA